MIISFSSVKLLNTGASSILYKEWLNRERESRFDLGLDNNPCKLLISLSSLSEIVIDSICFLFLVAAIVYMFWLP